MIPSKMSLVLRLWEAQWARQTYKLTSMKRALNYEHTGLLWGSENVNSAKASGW